MHFGLNEDQTMLQDSVGRYLEGASELALVRGFVDGDPGLAAELQSGLMDLGVPFVLMPTEQGGLGMGVLEAALIQEALGRNVSPSPFTAAYGMAVMALRTCGDSDWLGRIASGEVVMGVGATEAIGAREGAGLALSDDKVLGRASFVMGAEAATHFLLTTGEQLLIVERGGAGVDEVALTTIDKTRHVVNLELKAASAHLVSGNNHGEAQSKMIDTGRVLLAADSLGAASMMLEKAVAYSKDREQFNRPIGSFQAVKHMCAEMAAKLEPCRSLVWYAAYSQDHVPEEAALTSRLAKAHVSEIAKFVARTSTEVHGGMGFTDLLGLHYWFKRIGANRQLLGGPQAVREEAAQVQGWVA
jgi:alkylation response protein AidB-like acyl-CoA dehydrogenase